MNHRFVLTEKLDVREEGAWISNKPTPPPNELLPDWETARRYLVGRGWKKLSKQDTCRLRYPKRSCVLRLCTGYVTIYRNRDDARSGVHSGRAVKLPIMAHELLAELKTYP